MGTTIEATKILRVGKIGMEKVDTIKTIINSKIDAIENVIANQAIDTIMLCGEPITPVKLKSQELDHFADDLEWMISGKSVTEEIVRSRIAELLITLMRAEAMPNTSDFRGTRAGGTQLGWVGPWIPPAQLHLVDGAAAANVQYGIAHAAASTWQSAFAAAADKVMGSYCTGIFIMMASVAGHDSLVPKTSTVYFVVNNVTYEPVDTTSLCIGSALGGGAATASLIMGGDNINHVPICPLPSLLVGPSARWRMYARAITAGIDNNPLGGFVFAPAQEIVVGAATYPTDSA